MMSNHLYLISEAMKYVLEDLAFLVLVKFDTIERLENAVMLLDYLDAHFKTNIYLWEIGTYDNGILQKLKHESYKYKFFQDDDPILHRTKYINQMVCSVKEPYVAVWDVDVLIPPVQVSNAVDLLRNDAGIEVVYPYKGYFYEISQELRKFFYANRSIDFLCENKAFMNEMYPPNPVGGAFIIRRQSYIDSGLENTAFYGWGVEDGERFLRWTTQHLKIERIDGPLFHLTHPRSINSVFITEDDNLIKKRILFAAGRGI